MKFTGAVLMFIAGLVAQRLAVANEARDVVAATNNGLLLFVLLVFAILAFSLDGSWT